MVSMRPSDGLVVIASGLEAGENVDLIHLPCDGLGVLGRQLGAVLQ
jgi:hypothetical protein